MNKTNDIDKLDFWAKSDNGMYYHICEGTGDNLLPEDVDDGYVDYIYYDAYQTIQDIYENNNIFDGGMILLKKLYQDMTLKQIINEVKNFESLDKLEVIK